MTPDEYLHLVASRLSAGGAVVNVGQIGGLHTVLGYRSQFRLTWMATRLHLITAVAAAPGPLTAEGLRYFTDAALDYAKSQKGQWRGFQSGVGVIAALVGHQVAPDAAAYANGQLVRKFAAFAWPAAVDLTSRQVYSHTGRVAIGGIYAGYMREQTALALPPLA